MSSALPSPVETDAEPGLSRARLIRDGSLAVGGGVAAFLLMAHDARLTLGVPLGFIAVTICAIGVMGLLGTFHPPAKAEAPAVVARPLAKPAAASLASAFAVWLCLWTAVQGILPGWVAGFLLTVSFVVLVASLFSFGVALGPLRVDEDGNPRGILQRHGFWLFLVMACLFLPALGIGSLVDPWETHYGEVAREILARDDWISTWWSWEGFFYSKPVLGLWIQSIAMAVLGVHIEPGRMLEGLNGAAGHPEWAVRMPFVLFAMTGSYLLYKGASRWFGRRAALLGALVLSSCPQWFLVAHQSMTDMPFVASMAGAIGLVLCAARKDDVQLVSRYEVTLFGRTFWLSAWHLVFAPVLIMTIAQILYLLSRNLELVLNSTGPHGFRAHVDEIFVGSGLGNCKNQAGDPVCSTQAPVFTFEPAGQALLWTATLGVILALCRTEQRQKRVLYLGAWFMAGLATMAKGPGGLAIPMAGVGIWIGCTGRWREIPRMALVPGLLVLVLLVAPWWVAMYVRHGSAFTDELIFHDLYNRAFDHVHDTNTGADTSIVYYLQELGFGLFPWIALLPLGLFRCFGRDGTEEKDAVVLLLSWFGIVFGLFSFMGTKFHHYILPAVPPAAMLIGIALDQCFLPQKKTAEAKPEWSHTRAMFGAACIAGAMLAGLIGRDLTEGQARLIQLFTYRYDRPWPDVLDSKTPFILAGVVAVVLAVGVSITRTRRMAAFGWVGFALVWAAWGLDHYLPEASPHWGQRAVIEAYYQHRASAEEPIVAYRLNWKGENFYTGNRIPQFGVPTPPPNSPTFVNWIKDQRSKGAKVMYFVTEQHGVNGLKNDLAAKKFEPVTTREECNQFVLVRAEL